MSSLVATSKRATGLREVISVATLFHSRDTSQVSEGTIDYDSRRQLLFIPNLKSNPFSLPELSSSRIHIAGSQRYLRLYASALSWPLRLLAGDLLCWK